MINSTHDINFKPSSSAPQIKRYISRTLLFLCPKCEDLFRTRAKRPRSVYLFFYFFACVLFEKAVYLVYLTAGQLAVIKKTSLLNTAYF